MFVNLDTTFTALASVAPSIQETIVETPPTFAVATDTLPVIRPFLANSATLFRELRPGIRELAAAAPGIADSLEAGVPALRESPKLNRQLAPTARALQRFNDNATARSGLSRLEQTMDVFGPAIRFIGPSQTVCNYWSILFGNLASVTSLGADGGRHQRVTVFEPPTGPNNEGSLASAAANGPTDTRELPALQPVSEHRRPEPEPDRMRGGERAVPGRAAGDRERPGQSGHHHDGPAPLPDQAGSAMRLPWTRRSARGVPPHRPGEETGDPRIWGRRYRGPHPAWWGALAVVLLAIGSYLAYVKELPWSSPGYEVSATFENAATLRETAPVRIAGVNVGEVTSVEPAGDAAKVTFTVSEEGQPIHTDAEIEIRPRLFLEGNFFLDVRPGSPSAPELEDGGEIPMTQTATAVQLDEVLTALQQPQRRGLQRLLEGFGTGLTYEPTAADDRTQDVIVQGETAAESLNDAFTYGGPAGKNTAIVADALRGEEPRDLARMIDACGRRLPGAGQPRGRPRRPGDEPEHHRRRVRERVGEPLPVGRAPGPDPVGGRGLVARPERRAPAAAGAGDRVAARHPGAARHDRGVRALARADPPPAPAGGAGRHCQAPQGSGSGARHDRGRVAEAVPADAARGALHDAEPGPRGRHRRSRRTPAAGTTARPTSRSSSTAPSSSPAPDRPSTATAPICACSRAAARSCSRAQNPGGGIQDTAIFANGVEVPDGIQPVLPAATPPFRMDVACHQNDLPNINGPAAAAGPSDLVAAP